MAFSYYYIIFIWQASIFFCLIFSSPQDCPISSQGRAACCSRWEGTWIAPGSYLIPPHIFSGGGQRGLLQVWHGAACWREWLAFVLSRGGSMWIVCLFLVPSVMSILVLTVHFTVSSKLYLSQLSIFTFSASNSPLQPIPRKRGEGRGSKWGGLENLSGSTKLGSTNPKPQQRCAKWKSQPRLMCLPPATWLHRGPTLMCPEGGRRESCLPAPRLMAQWQQLSPTSFTKIPVT